MNNQTVQDTYSKYLEAKNIIMPGLRVANGIQGDISMESWNSLCSILPNSLEILARLFQRGLEYQKIVIPFINECLSVLKNNTEPILYKGVSYNPYIVQTGENFNLIDFYSYLRKSGFRGIIINASPYAVVNYYQKVPVQTYSAKSTDQVVKTFKNWFTKSNAIKKSSNLRGKYLEAIALSLFPQKNKPIVINGEEMWDSTKYKITLQEAIEYCSDYPNQGDQLTITQYANYNRYDTDFQRWYSVLVVAEAIYMNDVFGASIKLGPTSESNFDSLIRKVMQKRKSNFGFIWYDRTIEKEVSISERISFNDTYNQIQKKLLKNQQLRGWIGELVQPFASQSENDLVNTVNDIASEIKNLAADIKIPKLVEGGFLSSFPIGECD